MTMRTKSLLTSAEEVAKAATASGPLAFESLTRILERTIEEMVAAGNHAHAGAGASATYAIVQEIIDRVVLRRMSGKELEALALALDAEISSGGLA